MTSVLFQSMGISATLNFFLQNDSFLNLMPEKNNSQTLLFLLVKVKFLQNYLKILQILDEFYQIIFQPILNLSYCEFLLYRTRLDLNKHLSECINYVKTQYCFLLQIL